MGLELSSRAAPGPSSLHVAGRVGSVNLTPPTHAARHGRPNLAGRGVQRRDGTMVTGLGGGRSWNSRGHGVGRETEARAEPGTQPRVTFTAYSLLVMRLTQDWTLAWAPSPSTSSCSW